MTGLRACITRTTPAVVLLALSVAAFAVLCAARGLPMADVHVYRAEGAAVLGGTDLYGFTVTEWRLPATYPPFAALLFVPVAAVPLPVAKAAFLAGNAVLLIWLVHLSLRLARPSERVRRPVLLTAAAVGLWLEPVFQTAVFGQINLLLACLVVWDLNRAGGARGKGLAVGVAAGIKLTPALFAVYLLLTGRVRAGLTALAGFAGTVAAGGFVLPGATWDFFTGTLFETHRVGKAWIVDNQSLQGLAARLAHSAEPGLLWMLPAAAVAVAGLALARRLFTLHGSEGWGLTVTALTALLVSPISWSHHWVWCVPLTVLLAAEPAGRPAAAAVCAAFTARTLWMVPKHGDLDLRVPWWQQVPASPYPLVALAVLAAVAARCYSASGAGLSAVPYASGAPSPPAGPSASASRSCESTMR